jgi:hypothetical protein
VTGNRRPGRRVGAGVQVHVEDLAAYLAGGDRCDAEARFGELFPAYKELAAR